jgi:hypothetical protein
MAKGIAWKSQFLLPAIVFVVGMVATLCFSYFFYQRSEKDWTIRVDQTAERLSNTLLSWLEESYAPVSGLMALVENSNTVEPNEFLNAFESMQSRSTTVLLDEASLLRLNRVGQWQVTISSDALGYPGRYITLADVAATLSLASKRQNQFTLSPPFKSESGRTISAIALSASAAAEPTIVVGTLNYDTLFEGMRSGPVPKGIFLKLSGRFLGRPDPKSVVTPPNDRQFRRRGHRDFVGRDEGIRRRPILRSGVSGIAGRPKPNHWTDLIHRFLDSAKQTDRTEGGRGDACPAEDF